VRFAICVVMTGFASVSSAFAGDNNHPDSLAVVGLDRAPPVADVKPVIEVLWGVKVTDPYRYMEALDPTTKAWMKEQGDYTRAVFDAIKPRAALQQRIAQFTGSFGLIHDYAVYNGRSFYIEQDPGRPGKRGYLQLHLLASRPCRLATAEALRAVNYV
jgi:hypothetical protein